MIKWFDWSETLTNDAYYTSILDAFNVPAMLVRKDRMVLNANESARHYGVHPPCYCWQTLAKNISIVGTDQHHPDNTPPSHAKTRCTHCKADESLARKQSTKVKRILNGEVWESHYIPLNSNIFLYITRKTGDTNQMGWPEHDHKSLESFYNRIYELENENHRLKKENRQLKRWKKEQDSWSEAPLLKLENSRHDQKNSPEPFTLSDIHFRLAFESAAHGMALVATDGHWLKVNQALCDITGYKESELLSRTFQEITHPDDLEKDQAQLHRLLTGESTSYQTEKRYLRKNGQDVWVMISVSLVRNQWGQPCHFVSQIINIDDRKHYEAQFARDYAMLRSLIDTIPDLIFIKDNDLRIIGCNKAFEKRAGRSEQEMLGKNCFDLFPMEEAIAYYNSDMKMLIEGNSVSLEEIVESDSGEKNYFDTIKIPFYDQSNKPLGLIGVCRDITERKKHELELNRSKQDAEMASRAKSEFLANMSHEIRTPMSTILGMCELLQETRLTNKQKRFIHSMKQSGHMLLVIINDILDLSKIEANQLSLEHIPFSPDQLLNEIIDIFSFKAREKNITLIKNVVNGTLAPQMLGDPNRLRQILINLIGNAIKFTTQGSVTLEVKPHPKRLHTVIISVCDTGTGISPDRQKEIFLPFHQADASITRKHGGTGLGLTICRRLIDLMKGEITLESTPGEGSRFSCTIPLPVCNKPVALPDAIARTSNPSSRSDEPLAGLELLLAEDTEEISNVIEAYLQNTLHQVTTVRHGADAVAMIQSRHFDLVLMDLQMPVMDGYTAIQAIRAWEQSQGRYALPVLALTAHALSEETARIQSAGFNLHLTKPISKKHLLEVLATYSKPVASQRRLTPEHPSNI